ncbi:serine/threonine-protein kinase [Nocardioides sp. GXQ0305]|uniref:serine/threonine-protein kinase n=1 Tax=Nocardioides sp. GXQ0305 TaxID=3423912 RepID=UPI003D7E69FE
MPTPPEQIAGRYRVLEEAGRGGMGAVYRCVDERLGREVAVKQVGRMPGESVTDQARALREARSSAALNHANVVSVFDATAEGDHIWLVMEYVAGRTLSQILREDGRMPPHRAARIGAHVADGLAAAHERGTIHRDVKPGNVLITEGDRAKISDFGIARTAGDPSLTQSGILTGTPSYFAPEIARGGDPGPASDVWALGATLYHAVEGRPPYGENPNALQLLARVAAEEPPAPEHAGELAGPISRMLDRNPESRWSMTDVAHALHRIHDGQAPGGGTKEEPRAFAAAPAMSEPPPTEPAAAPTPAPATAPALAAAPQMRSRPRRTARIAAFVVALLALVVVAAVGLAQLGDDPTTPAADDEPSSDTSEPATSEGPATEGTPEESTPPETEESTPPETESEETQPASGGGGGRVAFVEDYYAALPDDTQAGYSRLSPSYQEQLSYGEYEGFWSGIGEVTVEDSAPTAGGAVDVTLLYDGGSEEVRRIHLVRGSDGWLISGDEIVG